MNRSDLITLISNNEGFDFDQAAVSLFQYQYTHNEVYRKWVDNLGVNPKEIVSTVQIPFIPISAFKSHRMECELKTVASIFLSSGTTGSIPSRHYVYDMDLYLANSKKIFESFYGPLEEYCILALLPSYLEREGSSLIAMVDYFIKASERDESGFYLYDHDALRQRLEVCKEQSIPTILFGVSFALMDFVESGSVSFPELVILETGGMKGRKKELTRDELHSRISKGFNVRHVHSEYGMTELFSQAYSQENGIFYPGETMRVVIKEITDPLSIAKNGTSGVVNIIDLANIDSCAFIETQDLGRKYVNGSFEILGRMDISDIRGCNLMVGEN